MLERAKVVKSHHHHDEEDAAKNTIPEADEEHKEEGAEEAKPEQVEVANTEEVKPEEPVVVEEHKEEVAKEVVAEEVPAATTEVEVAAVVDPEEEKVDLSTVGFVTDRKHLEQCGSPKIAGKKSIKVELKKGETYWYCTCGRSETQPFCDGSHNQEGCQFKPLKFTHEQEDGEYGIC
jgi:CDGSH-type Zn-finger protein